MVKLSILENHRSSYRALSTIFCGWYAYLVLVSGKIVKGIVEVSKKRLLINGTVISEEDPIKYYKTVKIKTKKEK